MNIRNHVIILDDIPCDVMQKKIKHVHLRVHTPYGQVKISAPLRMNLETIRLFGISKLDWIRKQQIKIKIQKREAPREYVDGESHYYLGQKYLLQVLEQGSVSSSMVILKHDAIELCVRKGTSKIRRAEILQNWYRQQLRELVSSYIVNLEKKMGVKVFEIRFKTMKTRWGTCNIRAKRIWLNTELAKKSIEHIEYVLIHEMVHLLERHHNEKFKAYMTKFSPNWKHLRKELNRFAIGGR